MSDADKPVIVAIDDEVDFTEMLNEYFTLRRYEIAIANRGVEGMALIKLKKPNVLILDLKMPGISGKEVMALAKEVQPKARIIFVSAYDDGGKTKSTLLRTGAYAYLDKPLSSLKDLEEVVLKAYADSNN